jgi:hypothetical protein
VRDTIKFNFVSTIDEVLQIALANPPKVKKKSDSTRKGRQAAGAE